MRILVAEDDDNSRVLQETLLSASGYEVTTAADGEQALALIQRDPPDLVLTDILMPKMDGYTLCKNIKDDPELKTIPVIFYTATYTDPRDEAYAKEIGASRFVVKPAEIEALLEIITEVITESRSIPPQRSENGPTASATADETYADVLTRKLHKKIQDLETEQRKRAETKSRYLRLVESLQGSYIFFTHDHNGVFTYISPSVKNVLGFSPPELMGHYSATLTEAPMNRITRNRTEAAIRGTHQNSFEAEVRHKSGSPRILEIEEYPIIDADGKVACVEGIAKDITERKLVEKELRHIKKDLEHAMRTARLGNWVWHIEEDRLWFSEEIHRMFDLDPGHTEDTKTLYWQAIHPEDRARVREATDRVLKGNSPLDMDYRIIMPDQSQRYVHEHSELFTDPVTQKPLRVSGTIQDITNRKQMEMENARLARQLLQTQKLEAIGTLASGIAHDFNNLLTPIMGFADILKSNLKDDEKNLRFVEKIINSADLAKDLVQQILAISRQNESKMQPVRLQSILKDDLKLLRASLPSTIAIDVDIAPQCRPVMADPTRLHQVVLNLCTNASHAMRSGGGTLSVSLAEIAPDPDGEKISSESPLESVVRLQIQDTGIGMDKRVLERVFDPYFTTKPKDEGTGLGLAVVRGIVSGHGGRIAVESAPGKGARFIIDLPACDAPAPLVNQSPSPALQSGTERILLVDDEIDILELEKEMLAMHGYRVTVFSDSHEALACFKQNTQQFDLVITDMTMPKLTGMELARQIHALNPQVPILVCSGYSDLIESGAVTSAGVYQCLAKPLNLISFVKSVRNALDHARTKSPL